LLDQIPILAFSFVLVAVKVDIELPFDVQQRSVYDKLRRIDILGSLTLVGTVCCLLLGFSLKSTEELPWSHPLIWGLFVASTFSGVLFVIVECYISPYPVMPMSLATQRTPLAVSISYLFTSISAFSMVRQSFSYAWNSMFTLIASFTTFHWYDHNTIRL
jgi:hypothetical protein